MVGFKLYSSAVGELIYVTGFAKRDHFTQILISSFLALSSSQARFCLYEILTAKDLPAVVLPSSIVLWVAHTSIRQKNDRKDSMSDPTYAYTETVARDVLSGSEQLCSSFQPVLLVFEG